MSEYTQGVCHDGTAIMKEGQPLKIEQILEALRERDALTIKNAGLIQQCAVAERQRDEQFAKLRTLNHGDRSEVWHWMGDGHDHLESLICPVLISADDLKSIFEERDALAAHVDRITGLCRDLDECELGSKEMADVWNDIQDAFLEEPSTSLAGRDARSNCPDCEGDGNIAFVTCPICDGEGKLSSDEVARLHAERLAAPMDSCELECGAYGTYCKCAAEAQQ